MFVFLNTYKVLAEAKALFLSSAGSIPNQAELSWTDDDIIFRPNSICIVRDKKQSVDTLVNIFGGVYCAITSVCTVVITYHCGNHLLPCMQNFSPFGPIEKKLWALEILIV